MEHTPGPVRLQRPLPYDGRGLPASHGSG
ncbi:hypothetical protein OF001_U10381 [Pseudomonas sp. OF001]|nr:hypothetical protein OF001_U10381 [Pseudomonas sp. OF001]